MGIATAAGAFYAPIVFLIGLIFGTIRVLILAPTTRRQRGGRSRNTHDACREFVLSGAILRPTGGQFLARIGLHLNTPSEINRVAQNGLAL